VLILQFSDNKRNAGSSSFSISIYKSEVLLLYVKLALLVSSVKHMLKIASDLANPFIRSVTKTV
jgi:hypothetical protein